jgi:hypothetical protein
MGSNPTGPSMKPNNSLNCPIAVGNVIQHQIEHKRPKRAEYHGQIQVPPEVGIASPAVIANLFVMVYGYTAGKCVI